MKKSERLNKELIYLSYRDQFHLKELEDEFNISERTALRDIANLEQIGLNFYVEKGRYGAYHLTKNKLWVPINFNLEEINAIFLALKALNKMTTTPFSNAYQQISHKLMKSLPKNRQDDIKTQQKVVSYRQQPTLHNVKYFKFFWLRQLVKISCWKWYQSNTSKMLFYSLLLWTNKIRKREGIP